LIEWIELQLQSVVPKELVDEGGECVRHEPDRAKWKYDVKTQKLFLKRKEN
jgi:hypothetical protein